MKSKLSFVCSFLLFTACAPLPKETVSSLPGQGGAGPVTGKNGTIFSYTGVADKVVIAGSFNDWSQEANPLRKLGEDRWETTLKLPSGAHQYKFVVDGNWITDSANSNTADDGVGGVNSVVTVSGAATGKAAGVVSAAGAPKQVKGGVLFTCAAPTANKVVLAGSFNNWSQDANPMSKNAAGVWSAIVPLATGAHQYKFVVDGNWITDSANSNTADDGVGGVNSVVTVSGAATTGKAAGVVSAAGAPKQVKGGILFACAAPTANKVVLAGSFNNWSQDANPMSKNAAGVWSAIVPLSSGSHQYKFVTDGNWIIDPSNSNTAADGLGGNNSVITLP
ncbi:MAG: hypothetical protein CVU78_00425 [Elusimicrobia bacterium HGW-Elusimicrobia-2]|nr:MAG: hypothetical protein CVU78_00425 [Elusimicrobia bacterium HGW-Elusimicrobia-2]